MRTAQGKITLEPGTLEPCPLPRMSDLFKTVFDRLVAAIVLFLFIVPIGLPLYLLVWWKLGRPVFFKQVRAGKDGKPFTMYKFRTMRNAFNPDGTPLSDDQRLTKLGILLRGASLDELPEFFNVLKGDMSLVGPRPLLMAYLNRYTPEQARRHEVRPGITGWAQVNGRNALSWEEKFALDVWYVDHRSFWLDLKILCMTVGKVFKREGISAGGHVTMPEFMGPDVNGE